VNSLALRGFLVEGKPDAVAKSFKEGVSLSARAGEEPAAMAFINISKKPTSTSMRTTPRSTRRSRM